MSENINWYTFIDAMEPLSQGDVLFNCPVFFPDPNVDYTKLSDPAKITMYTEEKDVIVITQSCDIERLVDAIKIPFNEKDKVAQERFINIAKTGIVLCPLANLREVPSKRLSSLSDNKIGNLHLLNEYHEEGKQLIDFLVVDFSTTYTVPFGVLVNWIKSKGEARPRLKSPFLELMAQRYGFRYMRVALETNSNIKLDRLNIRKKELNAKSLAT